MYVSLLILGVMVTMAGAAMIAFGIPINEFGLGNTLIVAGTTAFVGGLILIALSAAVKQLRRIAEAAVTRPGARMSRPTDLFDTTASGGPRLAAGPGRIPFPPKPTTEGRNRAPASFESQPAVDSAEDEFDRPRQFSSDGAPEPSVFPERDEAPLSPRAEPRFAAARERDTDELSESLIATAFSRLEVSLRPAPPSAAPVQNERFESFWPAESRPGKISDAEPKQEPAEADAFGSEDQAETRMDNESAPEPYAISILKSGVVDGMAYTLYSDGSIEAEMPQGTVRFASIAELRDYLEKSS